MLHLEINIQRRHVYVLVGVIALIVTILPVSSWASHQFNDVPNNNIFHDDIAWLADAGVTLGCNPPANDEFCPGDNVRRETMAAFLRRLAQNEVVDAKTAVTAQDADKLDGKDATDFLAASDAPVLTGDTMSGPATSVSGSNVTIEEVSVTTSTDGYLLITANSAWGGSSLGLISWLQLDKTTCSPATADVLSIAYGYAGNSATEVVTSNSLAGTTAVSAGSHTITLCVSEFTAGAHTVLGASVQALFIADGSVTTNLASAGDADELFGGLSD